MADKKLTFDKDNKFRPLISQLPTKINFLNITKSLEEKNLIRLSLLLKCFQTYQQGSVINVSAKSPEFLKILKKFCDTLIIDPVFKNFNTKINYENNSSKKNRFIYQEVKIKYKSELTLKLNPIIRNYFTNLGEVFLFDKKQCFSEIILNCRIAFNECKIKIKIYDLIKPLLLSEENKILLVIFPELNFLLDSLRPEETAKNENVYFFLSTLVFKLHFLKENIKNEILTNKENHSDFFIDSIILKTFIVIARVFLYLWYSYNNNVNLLRNNCESMMFRLFLSYTSVVEHNKFSSYILDFVALMSYDYLSPFVFEKMFANVTNFKVVGFNLTLFVLNNNYEKLFNEKDLNSEIEPAYLKEKLNEIPSELLENDLMKQLRKIFMFAEEKLKDELGITKIKIERIKEFFLN